MINGRIYNENQKEFRELLIKERKKEMIQIPFHSHASKLI